MAELIGFYQQHTPVSDPGRYAGALRALPREIPELVDMIGGLFAHFEADFAGPGQQPAPDRLGDVDLRSVSAMLTQVFELDPRPITEARPMSGRFLGVCRDASLLLCAILRGHGVAARLRYGMTAHLYNPRLPMHDHVVVEYWDDTAGRWKYADGRMYASVRQENGLADRFADDVPMDQFVTGGQAWLRCQADEREAVRMSGVARDAAVGHWLTRNLLMYDLASLAGWEPLMWDVWGYNLLDRPRTQPRGRRQLEQLGRLAELDPSDPAQWRELLDRQQHHRFIRRPQRVLSLSPAKGAYTYVAATRGGGTS
jgi:hypothetical protein